MKMCPRRILYLGSVLFKMGAAAASFLLLFWRCPSCDDPKLAELGWIGAIAMPTCGLLISLVLMVLHVATKGKGSRVSDLILLLTMLAGFVIITIALANGVSMCPLCATFWACIAGSIAIRALEGSLVSKYVLPVSLAGIAFLCVALVSEESRLSLTALWPKVNRASVGLPAGSPFPYRAKTKVVAIATDCTACAKKSLRKAIDAVRARGESVSVFVPESRPDLAPEFRDCTISRAPSDVYRNLRIPYKGKPMLFYVESGYVTACRYPSEVSREIN